MTQKRLVLRLSVLALTLCLVYLWIPFDSSTSTGEATPCELAGKWLSWDKSRKIEMYQSGAAWFGKSLWSSSESTRSGSIVFSRFKYDKKTRQYRGKLAWGDREEMVAAEIRCVGASVMKLTQPMLSGVRSEKWYRMKE